MPRQLPPTLNLVSSTLVQVGSGIIGGIKVHSYTLQCVCVGGEGWDEERMAAVIQPSPQLRGKLIVLWHTLQACR